MKHRIFPESNYFAVQDNEYNIFRLRLQDNLPIARAYREEVEKAIGNNEFTWFVPDHEDNEMDVEEMKRYEYVSDNWTRLS